MRLLALLCIVLVSAGCTFRHNDLNREFAANAQAAPATVSSAITTFSAEQSRQSWDIVEPTGAPVKPISVLAAGNDLFFLGSAGLWKVEDWKDMIARHDTLQAGYIAPSGGKVSGLAVQEFNNFACMPDQKRIVILDKSGDLVEYSIPDNKWRICRPNKPVTGSPDPDFIDLAPSPPGLCVLDPERNEIWKFACGKPIVRCFTEIMPWRAQPGDPYVGDGLSIAWDKDFYVLKRSGAITRYGGADENGHAVQKSFGFRRPKGMRPSRLICGPSGVLYVIERENNRVVAVDRGGARVRAYLFPAGSDIRGLMAQSDGFYVVNGNMLVYRQLDKSDPLKKAAAPHKIDSRLEALSLPLYGVRLPRHPGVWPGARRLYRYGVHQGVDFFHDGGCSAKVLMGTPAHAADAGKVIRADTKFQDMNASKYACVMHQCLIEHQTSDANEDLLRGCQVWVDHGNGLITRYAHLNKVKEGLKTGAYVSRGDVLGYVGVSGTGQNLPGRGKHPHLHFEVRLDGPYLGYGLTPGETIGVYEDIFGTDCDRGSHEN